MTGVWHRQRWRYSTAHSLKLFSMSSR